MSLPLRASLVIVLFCLAALPALGRGQEISVLDQALDLESKGQLAEALQVLRAAKPAPDSAEAKHAAALVAILRADAQIRQEKNEQARKTLEKLLPALDPLRDIYITHKAYTLLVTVESEDRSKVEQDAVSDLQEADQLAADGEYGEALFLYSRVSAIENLSPHLVRWARRGEEKTKAAQALATTPGFFGKTVTSGVEGLSTILVWIAYFGFAVGLVKVGHNYYSRQTRDGIGLQVEDWSAEPATQEIKSRSLTSELWLEICRGGNPSQHRSADLDVFEEPDGANLIELGSLRVEVPPLMEVAAVLPEGSPVQLGPFSLSPRQVFASLQSLFHRPSSTLLRGALSVQDEEVVLCVEKLVGGETVERWEVREKTRALAVQQMALRIVFDLAQERVTRDWDSFRELNQGMDLLRTGVKEESQSQALASAARHFQRSLRLDPANWLARFYLATVERRLGRNEMAAQHFNLLKELPARRPDGNFAHFLARQPQFAPVLEYNRLVALSKANNEKTVWEAIEGLKALIAGLPQKDSQGDRLQLLARSALAAALSHLMDRQGRKGSAQGTDRREPSKGQSRLLDNIREIVAWIDGREEDSREDTLACAVIYTAYGRALYLVKRDEEAIQRLRGAIAFEPELLDAHVHLAEIFVNAGGDALQLAEERLQEALRISPSNQRVHFLLGRLYFGRKGKDYEKAKEHFNKAERFARSHELLAEIYSEQDWNFPEAINAMRRSLSMNPEPDYRFQKLIGYILRLDRRGEASEEQLLEARRRAEQLAQKGKEETLRQKGVELKGRVQRALDRLAQKSAPRPAAPATA